MDYKRINQDLLKAEELFFHQNKMLMVIGSARLDSRTPEYHTAVDLTTQAIKQGNFDALVSGGGPAIMEAANKAAVQAGVKSMGCGIKLPFEQDMNKHVKIGHDFEHFFTRKYAMVHSCDALLAFKGGIGTLDEFFEIFTLIQTKQMNPIPIVLFDKDYWSKLIDWDLMLDEGVLSAEDLSFITITSDIKEALDTLATELCEGDK